MKYFYFGLAVLNVIFCMLNIVGSNAIDVILVNIIALCQQYLVIRKEEIYV